jgi:hypothetical protein
MLVLSLTLTLVQKEHYKGITYLILYLEVIFTPRSYNLTGLPLKMLLVSNCMLEEDNCMDRKKINMMISQRIWANFNGKYDFTSWLNADFRIGSDFNLNR